MKHLYCLLAVLLVSAPFSRAEDETPEAAPARPAVDDARPAPSRWEASIIQLEVTRKQYEYLQPWSKRMKTTAKSGIVTGPREILTTADEMFDRTLVRLQKGGRGKWYLGEVTWIDYHANLALVTTSDEEFWRGLSPARMETSIPSDGTFQILRWRNGKLELRRADFSQFTVGEGKLSFVPHLQLELTTEAQGNGWGEAVLVNSQLVGIIAQQSGTTCTILPASFVLPILTSHQENKARSLGYFEFVWQPAENPEILAYLKLEGEPRGVVITEVPKSAKDQSVLKQHDLILKVDGFEIDTQGDYRDPDYGYLSLENLATRQKWAEDTVTLTLWRDGKRLEVDYQIPKADYTKSLVPDAAYDQEPEYLIAGGLVFQPLNDPFLQSWGADWKRRAPFRLNFFNNESPTKERPALVVLSQVLPDIYNLGYQEIRYLVVDKVNGQTISRLEDLKVAFAQPKEGFHVIEFIKSDSLRRLVLDATDLAGATQRVLTRYGIPKDSHLEMGAGQPVASR
jgi:hypothetical protein